jgi:hypothetical protein
MHHIFCEQKNYSDVYLPSLLINTYIIQKFIHILPKLNSDVLPSYSIVEFNYQKLEYVHERIMVAEKQTS